MNTGPRRTAPASRTTRWLGTAADPRDAAALPANSSLGDLAELLVDDFTVYRYDRRGRGDSTDTSPYAPAREVDDVAALIARAGEPVSLYGYSSGALVAVHAAAAGLDVHRLALLEPPIDPSGDAAPKQTFTARLQGGRDDAVTFSSPLSACPGMVGTCAGHPAFHAWARSPTAPYDAQLAAATDAGLWHRANPTWCWKARQEDD